MKESILALLLFASSLSLAQNSQSRVQLESPRLGFSSPFYIVIDAGTGGAMSLMGNQIPAANVLGRKDTTLAGARLGWGQYLLSFETGVQYFRPPMVVGELVAEKTNLFSVSPEFVAIPLLARINFYEREMNAFYFKAGILQSFRQNQEPLQLPFASTLLEFPSAITWATLGFGGTSAISNSLAFLIDASYFRSLKGLGPLNTLSDTAAVSLGVMIAL